MFKIKLRHRQKTELCSITSVSLCNVTVWSFVFSVKLGLAAVAVHLRNRIDRTEAQMEGFGLYRVLSPVGSSLQAADVVDSTPELMSQTEGKHTYKTSFL